ARRPPGPPGGRDMGGGARCLAEEIRLATDRAAGCSRRDDGPGGAAGGQHGGSSDCSRSSRAPEEPVARKALDRSRHGSAPAPGRRRLDRVPGETGGPPLAAPKASRSARQADRARVAASRPLRIVFRGNDRRRKGGTNPMRKPSISLFVSGSLVFATASIGLGQAAKKPAEKPKPPAVSEAHVAPAVPKPSGELGKLNWMKGTWQCTGKTMASSMGPEHPTEAHVEVDLGLAGSWLVSRYREKRTAQNTAPIGGD